MFDTDFFSHMMDRVRTMHEAFGHPVNETFQYDLDQSMIDFRIKLIEDEQQEAKSSLDQFDPVNYAREVCDIGVVSCGTKWVIGETDIANNTALYPSLLPYDLVRIIEKNISDYHYRVGATNTTRLAKLADRTAKAICQANTSMPQFHIAENFDRVMDANMSKFMSVSMAKETLDFYISKGVDVTIEFSDVVGKHYVKRHDGKFMKPLDFQPPKITTDQIDQTDKHSLI